MELCKKKLSFDILLFFCNFVLLSKFIHFMDCFAAILIWFWNWFWIFCKFRKQTAYRALHKIQRYRYHIILSLCTKFVEKLSGIGLALILLTYIWHKSNVQCTLMLRFVENCRSDLVVLLFKESIPSVCTLNNLMFVCNIYMNQG